MTIIYAILIFCVLIFVHEFGHFIVAKMCGIRVDEFAIGMGPALFQRQKGETMYSVRIFPIGGFCAMGEDEESDEPNAFVNKPDWQKACVLAAGSFMNLLTCVVLLIVIAFYVGSPSTTINEVRDGSPAYEAGLQSGDTVLSIDGETINEWADITTLIGSSEKDSVEIVVNRDGEEVTVQSGLEYDEDAQRNVVGITPATERNPGSAVVTGIKNTGNMTVMMYKTIVQLFTGDVSVKELSGPVGIVYATSVAANSGVIYVVYLAALLGLNLAIMNMLPFPALDGGRLLFLVIRRAAGKKMSDAIEGKVHFVGICLLFTLMIYVTFNDVIKYIIPIF